MPTKIDLARLRQLLDDGAQLVEALPRDEYTDEHLPGAANIPLTSLDATTVAGLDPVELPPGAILQMLLSSTARDRGAGVAPIQAATLHALTESYAAWDLAVTEARPATAADVTAHSTWGRRLGAGTRRSAWLLRAQFASPGFGRAPVGSAK